MLGAIKKLFVNKTAKTPPAIEDPQIPFCVLLLEAAHVDGECSDLEKEHMIATLVKECGITRSEIDDFLDKSDTERRESVDLFRFTRYLNNTMTKEQRIEMMEAVWRIILIDGHLEQHEDHFAHKLANLLRLTHSELIGAKLSARKQLANQH
ncbi:tellurite resistance TerB family protein [Desulforhopalus singaporensis]|uniref:Uncharacterized conserved protein, tellurite resistance protein B (TerB) family n=1 Tax=Desulforhopalus singaporensis TaxID=91360 RepID=A0A1H0JZE2_9BACT|nr:TerB family tellurite resistance protein [Desulforhopalus singaporensis]SDO49024.1 Uncharacterized conserved protein, tellurite resistance protein B (TerB) family [Desulforhopalus singaporensis]